MAKTKKRASHAKSNSHKKAKSQNKRTKRASKKQDDFLAWFTQE